MVPSGQPPTSLREAVPADVPVILQLIRELATYERAPQGVTATEDELRKSLFGPTPAAHVLLACEGDEPVGFAVYYFNYSTWLARRGLHLDDLFVRPPYRGHGHGRALLQRLGQIAHEHECGRMEWNVLDWNEPAIGFYKSLGAVPMDEWTMYRLTADGIAKLAAQT